jgi:hypothetical protein
VASKDNADLDSVTLLPTPQSEKRGRINQYSTSCGGQGVGEVDSAMPAVTEWIRAELNSPENRSVLST